MSSHHDAILRLHRTSQTAHRTMNWHWLLVHGLIEKRILFFVQSYRWHAYTQIAYFSDTKRVFFLASSSYEKRLLVYSSTTLAFNMLKEQQLCLDVVEGLTPYRLARKHGWSSYWSLTSKLLKLCLVHRSTNMWVVEQALPVRQHNVIKLSHLPVQHDDVSQDVQSSNTNWCQGCRWNAPECIVANGVYMYTERHSFLSGWHHHTTDLLSENWPCVYEWLILYSTVIANAFSSAVYCSV